MPMIILTVPPGTTSSQCEEVDLKIKTALRNYGVKGGITVWPVLLASVPGRLLLEYKSRQDESYPTQLAQAAGEAAQKVFDIQVETVTIKLDPNTTGIHITGKGDLGS